MNSGFESVTEQQNFENSIHVIQLGDFIIGNEEKKQILLASSCLFLGLNFHVVEFTASFQCILGKSQDPCPKLQIWGLKHGGFEVHFHFFQMWNGVSFWGLRTFLHSMSCLSLIITKFSWTGMMTEKTELLQFFIFSWWEKGKLDSRMRARRSYTKFCESVWSSSADP